VAFSIAGVGAGLAWAVRPARRRSSTLARLAGGVLTRGLFVGAGGIMFPTVVGAVLARWRTDWRRWARITAAVLAVPVEDGRGGSTST
jgi:hypothetical protein